MMYPDVTGPKLIGHGRKLSLMNVGCFWAHSWGFVPVMGTGECDGGICPGDNAAATAARVIPSKMLLSHV